MDVHTPERRSHNMSRIRSRDTKPELLLRRALHARGLRYRLHVRDLPGRPDLVFPGKRAVIFVNGCFWHGHDCPLFRVPATRSEFWIEKIRANVARDQSAGAALEELGWRQLVVWECALRGRARMKLEDLATRAAGFLRSQHRTDEIAGAWSSATSLITPDPIRGDSVCAPRS
ncbi:very short patch repair endonuclease [Sphingomonas sp. BK345]|uniref:very short patch repair endonuclease n=1 Tax=Sphingomonas sp. BK345 TaxID=2586980 RepID=UPI00288C5DA2|nr:very short patch repair endonuclease [Sphingomonas sp. BK345]